MLPRHENLQYAVNLTNHTCTCCEFENHNIPYQHKIAMIFTLRHQLDTYIPCKFLTETWKRIYEFNLHSIVFESKPPGTKNMIKVLAPIGRAAIGKSKNQEALQDKRAGLQGRQSRSALLVGK